MSFHASSFFLNSWHSFCNFVHSIILIFNFLFSVVNYNILALTFSFVSFFCFFQITICCLYSSYPSCSYFICCNNHVFLPPLWLIWFLMF
jgi:hypothetical protein